MKEAYDLLYNLGEIWREENTIEKEIKKGDRKGETDKKVLMPSVSEAGNNIRKAFYFTFIGRGLTTDTSHLYIYHYDLGYYIASDDLLRKIILKFDIRLTSTRIQNEIKTFLRTVTKIKTPFNRYDIIPVQNSLFNIRTKQLEPFNPNYAITSKIKTAYNPTIKKPILNGWFDFDEWLNSLACGDEEIVTLLWQVLNEAINPNRTRKKMVIMLGEGNNGKGTFQALLEGLIGRDNISNLKPDQFAKDFYTQALDGKTCNIGDDISSKYLDEVSDLMSVVSGDHIQVNRKGKNTIEATYKLLCIFSANEMPNARNKTQGWYRRLCIVPFNADFNGQKERPEIKDEFMKNKELMEYVLFRILNMNDFEKFIEVKSIKPMLEDYKNNNDFILTWVNSFYIPNGWHEINHVPIFIARNKLKEFVEDLGIDRPQLGNFGTRLIKILEKETANKYKASNGTVSPLYYDALDPHGFQRERISKGGVWEIKKKG